MPSQGSKRRRTNNQEAGGARGGASGYQNVDPAARTQTAMQLVMEVMQGKDQLSVDDLLSEANAITTTVKKFSRAELNEVLSALDDENKIMFYDDMVHKV